MNCIYLKNVKKITPLLKKKIKELKKIDGIHTIYFDDETNTYTVGFLNLEKKGYLPLKKIKKMR